MPNGTAIPIVTFMTFFGGPDDMVSLPPDVGLSVASVFVEVEKFGFDEGSTDAGALEESGPEEVLVGTAGKVKRAVTSSLKTAASCARILAQKAGLSSRCILVSHVTDSDQDFRGRTAYWVHKATIATWFATLASMFACFATFKDSTANMPKAIAATMPAS